MNATQEPAIDVQGLVKRFGTLTAVDGLNLQVMRGECFGLLGPNGAGKTTTVEILEGLQRADGGQVKVLGLTWEKDERELRQRLGVQLQESQLYDRLTVQETVELFASFFPKAAAVEDAIKAVDLQDKRHDWVVKLSGGQKQRLAVATCLVGNPDLFFFDEPTTGLDPTSRRQLWEVLSTVRASGRTIILTTHYMDEAERLCDRVAIIDKGKVIALGTPAELIRSVGGDQIIELSASPTLSAADFEGLPGLVEVSAGSTHVRLTVQQLHLALPAVLARVAEKGAKVAHLITHQPTLEDVFLKLAGHGLQDEANGAAAGGSP